MDLYFKGYDPDARITSAAKHLSAAAARFAASIVRSIPHLPDAAWQELQRLLTVEALWSLCLVLAGWLVATVVGGLVGLAVNALLIAYGLSELWKQIKAAGGELQAWAMAAYQAQNDAELDLAAQHFATALSVGGITILEVVLSHRVFRAVEGVLRERFPTPDWLKKQYDEAAKQREKPRRPIERAAEVLTGGVRLEGAKKVAEDFPTAAVALGGAVVAVGSLAVAVWAMNASSRKVRP